MSSSQSRVTTLRKLPHPRHYVATSPLPSGQSPVKNANNTILFAVAAATAVGAYYYMRNQSPEELSVRVERDQATMAQKARESLDAGKALADDARKQAEQKYEENREAAQGIVEQRLHNTESRIRGLSSDALSRTRGSIERAYDDKIYDGVRSEVGKQGGGVKQGWFNWLGCGSGVNRERTEKKHK